ncbi:hypothetical protein ACS0TY_000288 [Phlomoides rotata]
MFFLGNTVYLWDALDRSTSELNIDDEMGHVNSVKFAPDGRHIVVAENIERWPHITSWCYKHEPSNIDYMRNGWSDLQQRC